LHSDFQTCTEQAAQKDFASVRVRWSNSATAIHSSVPPELQDRWSLSNEPTRNCDLVAQVLPYRYTDPPCINYSISQPSTAVVSHTLAKILARARALSVVREIRVREARKLNLLGAVTRFLEIGEQCWRNNGKRRSGGASKSLRRTSPIASEMLISGLIARNQPVLREQRYSHEYRNIEVIAYARIA